MDGALVSIFWNSWQLKLMSTILCQWNLKFSEINWKKLILFIFLKCMVMHTSICIDPEIENAFPMYVFPFFRGNHMFAMSLETDKSGP